MVLMVRVKDDQGNFSFSSHNTTMLFDVMSHREELLTARKMTKKLPTNELLSQDGETLIFKYVFVLEGKSNLSLFTANHVCLDDIATIHMFMQSRKRE